MSLLLQLFLLAVVPLGFGMMAATEFRNAGTRPTLAKIWAGTLLVAGIWSSSLLIPFVFWGSPPTAATFTWSILSRYALSLFGIGLLWTTLVHIETVPNRVNQWIAATLGVWGVAIVLDPSIWRYRLPPFSVGSWQGEHFDLWGVVWVASGLLPALIAWLTLFRFYQRLPHSLYRQHVFLGTVALATLVIGLMLAYPHLPQQLFWSQVSGALCLIAARVWMPSRMSQRGKWSTAGKEDKSAGIARLSGHLFNPQTIGQHLLTTLQEQLHIDNAHLFLAHLEAGGRLMLRPLASLRLPMPAAIALSASNSIARQLQEQNNPIAWYDIQKVSTYATIPPDEHQALANLHPVLLLPLQAHAQLVAVLLLPPRQNNKPFAQTDFFNLQTIASQIAPLLWQSLIQANLYTLAHHVSTDNRRLGDLNRYQQALTLLYQQLMNLITPDLRQPLVEMEIEIQRLQSQYPDLPLHALAQMVTQHKNNLEGIIGATARLEKQATFRFAPLTADTLLRDAVANLQAMVQGRRIQLTQKIQSPLPPLWGDQQRLTEAVQNILHNALKFNRIGGQVTIECCVEGGEVAIHISDTGVGIPSNRLDQLWATFSRTSASKMTSVSGLRLGLPIAHFIVQSHGGRLAVQSEYGVGTRFSLYLPIIL